MGLRTGWRYRLECTKEIVMPELSFQSRIMYREKKSQSKACQHLKGEWKKTCLHRKLRREQGYQENVVLEVRLENDLRCFYV